MTNGSYRPSNVVGGITSLKPVHVEGQSAGSLYSYEPPQDAKPTRNEAWVRWSVMIGVSAADLAVVGLMLTGAVVRGRYLARDSGQVRAAGSVEEDIPRDRERTPTFLVSD